MKDLYLPALAGQFEWDRGPRAVNAGDPYNSAATVPAPDTIEWDENTIEVVVLETVPE